jgi:hypothetical protein
MRAVLTIVFVLAVSQWLSGEFRRKVLLAKYWRWLAGAAVLQLGAQIISNQMSNQLLGNILLHTIGGGVASACLFFYIIYTFEIKINWRLQLLALFMLVSTFGVMNELWEYSFELLHLGKYSFDTHDTWRDLTSNTGGALAAWLSIRIIQYIGKNAIVSKKKAGS